MVDADAVSRILRDEYVDAKNSTRVGKLQKICIQSSTDLSRSFRGSYSELQAEAQADLGSLCMK